LPSENQTGFQSSDEPVVTATEVLEGGATTALEIENYFSRITTSRGRAHETEAAQRVQQQVAIELRRK
jgi:hypothetical protein